VDYLEYVANTYGIDLLLLIAFIMMAILYLFQYFKSTLLLRKEKQIKEIFSWMTNEPYVIFSDDLKAQYFNQEIKSFLDISHSGTIKNVTKKIFKFEDDPNLKSFSDLISIYSKKAVAGKLYLSNITIKANGKNKHIDIRIVSDNKRVKNKYYGLTIINQSEMHELAKLHYHDVATGLPNRYKAVADINKFANAKNNKFAVAILSIDNYLSLVSTVGYRKALNVTSALASYFSKKYADSDKFQIYSMSDNHFMLLIKNINSKDDALLILKEIKHNFDDFVNTKECNHHLTFSTGISVHPETLSENILSEAYGALFKASKGGGGQVAVSEQLIKKKKINSIEYNEIKKALIDGQFIMFYQPLYDIKKRAIVGAEALLRWMHPQKGVIFPDSYLPMIEKTSFMESLGDYVIEKVAKQLAMWNSLGLKHMQIAINLSLREFETSDYHQKLKGLLDKYKISPSQIKVEITENIAMVDEAYTTTQLNKLREMGVEISLDDFGTGYSSFSMVESLPINTVKIDKSFILDLPVNEEHQTMVKAIIDMAHSMKIKVIAEGVENQNIIDILENYGCDYLQGYHFGKAMPAIKFQNLIKEKGVAPEETFKDSIQFDDNSGIIQVLDT